MSFEIMYAFLTLTSIVSKRFEHDAGWSTREIIPLPNKRLMYRFIAAQNDGELSQQLYGHHWPVLLTHFLVKKVKGT